MTCQFLTRQRVSGSEKEYKHNEKSCSKRYYAVNKAHTHACAPRRSPALPGTCPPPTACPFNQNNNNARGSESAHVFVIVVVAVCVIVVANLRRSTTGLRWLAVRSNERAAAAAGVDVTSMKFLAFGVASALAGVGGVLTAYQLTRLSPDVFLVFGALATLALLYLGGVGRITGALIAGAHGGLQVGVQLFC